MAKTTTFFKGYLSIDEEEAWLNEMCSKGWKLTYVILGFAFQFEKCEENEYICRTYCVTSNGTGCNIKKKELVDMLKESGAETVEHSTDCMPGILYLIRKSSLGKFEIDTDVDSKIRQYKRRKTMHGRLGIIFLLIGVVILLGHSITGYSIYYILGIGELICGVSVFLPIFKYSKIIKSLEEEHIIHE